MRVDKNRTHYSSVDINDICDRLTEVFNTYTQNYLRTWAEKTPETINIGYWSGPKLDLTNRGEEDHILCSLSTHGTLCVLRPSALQKLFPLEFLGAISNGCQTLPKRVLAPLVEILMVSVRAQCRLTAEPAVLKALHQEIVSTSQIHVLRKIADPLQKLTASESLRYMHKMYGHGKNIPGQYQWEERLTKAEQAYTKEYKRLTKWGAKIAAKGDSVTPYHTWAEYLRACADEHERIENRRKR